MAIISMPLATSGNFIQIESVELGVVSGFIEQA
jgi:hypothetical protein